MKHKENKNNNKNPVHILEFNTSELLHRQTQVLECVYEFLDGIGDLDTQDPRLEKKVDRLIQAFVEDVTSVYPKGQVMMAADVLGMQTLTDRVQKFNEKKKDK